MTKSRRCIQVLSLMTCLMVSGPSAFALAPRAAGAKGSKPVQPLPQPVKVTTVEGITECRLGNGLRVLLFPDPGKPTATVNITYLVGSRNENYGETGMAHLLEHLTYKGTPEHRDIFKELTEHGTRPNGSTSYDRTNYFASFQATDENLRWALELEADRMIHSDISKKDLWDPQTQKGEMSVVRNEFEAAENNGPRVLSQRVIGAAFQWHAYGKPTIGCLADIENVNEEHLQAFYHNYYQPDNAVLTVAGKFDEAKTLRWINDLFGIIPKPKRILRPTYTVEPAQDGERSVTVRRAGDVQWLMIGYHIPAGSDPSFAAVEVLTQILADTPTGRLHKQLVETKKAAAAFGSAHSLKEPGFLTFGLQVRKETSLEEAKDGLLKTVEDSMNHSFTAEDVDRAKTQIITQVELALNDAENIGMYLSEFIALGDWRLFFLERDRVKAVTVADVERVAKAYLKPSNRTLGMFLPTDKPDRAEIPPLKDVEAMVKDYKGDAAVTQGAAFDARPEAIEPLITYSAAPSGQQLAVISKKNRGASVSFHFKFLLGDEKSLMNKGLAGSFAANLLMRGTTKRDRAQIADLLDKVKMNLNISGNPEQLSVAGETTREHFAEAMALVAEILKEPAFPETEFELLRQKMLANLEQQRSDPVVQASLSLRRLLDPYPAGHPLHVRSLDERAQEIKALKLEDVKAFYQSFYGAGGAKMAIVGDVDTQEARKLTEDLFGNWKSPLPWTRISRIYREAPVKNLSLETPDKPNAFFCAGMMVPIQDTDPDYPAMELGDFMLGGGFLNSRLATRIRRNEGLSYDVGSQFETGSLDKASTWIAYAIYAPQNLTRLEAAFREELDKALKDGFTLEEIKAAKSGYLQQRQVSRAQDRELAHLIASNLQLKRTLAYDTDLERKIKALTNDQIVAALRKYLDPAKLVFVKAGDFAKTAQKP
jgi:zinc protease